MSGFWLISYLSLWLVVLCQTIAITELLRQIGVLHLRLRPAGARTMNAGPDLGARLPEARAHDAFGREVDVVAMGRPRMLLFVSPECSVCEGLLPGVKTIAKAERRRMDVVLLTALEDEKANRAYVEDRKLGGIPYVASRTLAESYRVMSAPYAVVLDEQGVVRAKGLVNHIEHLESLIEALRIGHPTLESYIRAENGRTSDEQRGSGIR